MNHTPGAPAASARWLPLLLVVACGLAYAGSLSAPFVFDDIPAIVNDRSIRELWPLERVLGHTNRPLLKLSFALNHAIGGLAPAGFRLTNVVIHALASIALFGVVRRTLLSEYMRERFASGASRIAFLVALLWLVHPLQTEAVTYVYQRGESLAGLFTLLGLYALIRGHEGRRPRLWGVAVVVACVLGLATKEVAVTAPLLLLIYDRTFLAGSLRGALGARRGIYASLAVVWLALLVLFFGEAIVREGATAGFGVREISSLEYAATQPEVVLHYLRLALWPSPLCLDYGWRPATGLAEVLLPAVIVLAAVAVAVRGLVRGSAAGFLVASFFLLLAPTSSIMPIRDLAAEHRMYLPLAAVVLGAVLALRAALRRSGASARWIQGAIALAVAASLLGATVVRNRDYRDPVTTWSCVAERAPTNPRAHLNLGLALHQAGETGAAAASYRRALALQPDYAEAHNNLGSLLVERGRIGEAIEHLRAALDVDPGHPAAHVNLARALLAEGRGEEALVHLRRAVAAAPGDPLVHQSLGVALAALGRRDEASAELERALELDPELEAAREQLEQLSRGRLPVPAPR